MQHLKTRELIHHYIVKFTGVYEKCTFDRNLRTQDSQIEIRTRIFIVPHLKLPAVFSSFRCS